MTVKDYSITSSIIQDMEVKVEYYFTNNPYEKKQYMDVRQYQIEKIVKCVEDNTFKLKIYVNDPNELYDGIIKDIKEITKQWFTKYCEIHDSCLSCPYHTVNDIKYGDSETTHCKLKHIAYSVNLTTVLATTYVKDIKGIHD